MCGDHGRRDSVSAVTDRGVSCCCRVWLAFVERQTAQGTGKYGSWLTAGLDFQCLVSHSSPLQDCGERPDSAAAEASGGRSASTKLRQMQECELKYWPWDSTLSRFQDCPDFRVIRPWVECRGQLKSQTASSAVRLCVAARFNAAALVCRT